MQHCRLTSSLRLNKNHVVVNAEILLLSFNSGITNYEEYSLIQELVEEKKEDGMGTLKKDRTLLRDERKMEKLKAKLHTDDDCELKHGVRRAVCL